jgi:hypothetical protein
MNIRGAFATMVYTLRKQLDSLMTAQPTDDNMDQAMTGEEGEGQGMVVEGTGEGEGVKGEGEGQGQVEEGEGGGGEEDLLFADLDEPTPMQSD